MFANWRRDLSAALALGLLALGLARGVPLLPFCWQGESATAKVVRLDRLTATTYEVTLAFPRPGDPTPLRATRRLFATRYARRLTQDASVQILFRPDRPESIMILSYPGADWLPPAILFTFGLFFSLVWRKTPASRR